MPAGAKMGRVRPFGNRAAGLNRAEDAGLMAASLDEADQVARCEPRGGGVLQRMAVNLGEIQQRRIDHDDDPGGTRH